MFSRGNVAISNPSFAAETQSFSVVSEKEKKKERAELAHLAALLQALEEELSGAKTEVKGGKIVSLSAAKNTEAAPKTSLGDALEQAMIQLALLSLQEREHGNSNEKKQVKNGKGVFFNASQAAKDASKTPGESNFAKAMAEFALLLQELQVEITKFSRDKSEIDQENAADQVIAAKQALKEFEKKVAEMKEKKAHESFWNKFVKALEIIAVVIVDVVACICGNPGIAVFVTAMLVASLTGALSKATKAIGSGLTDMVMAFEKLAHPHMSSSEEKKIDQKVKDICDIVAAVVVMVAVIIATGAFAPSADIEAVGEVGEEAASTATSEGTEMTNFAEDGASTTEATQSSTPALNRAMQILGKIRKALNLSTKTSMQVMAGSQAASQTGLAEYVADASVDFQSNLSPEERKKKKEQAEMEAQMIMTIITLVATLVAGSSLTSNMSSGARDLSKLGKLGSVLKKFQDSKYFLPIAEGTRKTANLAQGVGGVAEGSVMVNEGELVKQMAEITASLQILHADMDMNARQIKEDSQYRASVMQQQNTDNRALSKLMAGQAAIANTLTAYSPV